MSEFEDFLKLVAKGKKDYKENDPVGTTVWFDPQWREIY